MLASVLTGSLRLQEYVHQLGILLVEAAETHSQKACSRLDQLSIETGSLLICMALSNPTAFKAMQSTRLDNFEEVSQPNSFFLGMLVSMCSCSISDTFLTLSNRLHFTTALHDCSSTPCIF